MITDSVTPGRTPHGTTPTPSHLHSGLETIPSRSLLRKIRIENNVIENSTLLDGKSEYLSGRADFVLQFFIYLNILLTSM